LNPKELKVEDYSFLSCLAVAFVESPRANLKELANAAGVSKATLYRFCQTREELFTLLIEHSIAMTNQAVNNAGLVDRPVPEALHALIDNHYSHRELTSFLIMYGKEAQEKMRLQQDWSRKLDEFFLRGQNEGFFRIDISSSELSEVFIAMVVGLIDSERQGRIAKNKVKEIIKSAFLEGVRKV